MGSTSAYFLPSSLQNFLFIVSILSWCSGVLLNVKYVLDSLNTSEPGPYYVRTACEVVRRPDTAIHRISSSHFSTVVKLLKRYNITDIDLTINKKL
jgi:hypothetical protein